jgi:holo-[acyl-carrier protein] synthase
MEIFTGIDIIELTRFDNLADFRRVAEYILSPTELRLMDSSRDSRQFLASRFAAKEAIVKALPGQATLADIEIENSGLKLVARPMAPPLDKYKISLSITHSELFAAAVAVVVSE